MELKIQFIITGWHYNQDSLLDGLLKLSKEYPTQIDVFFACHNNPPEKVKKNFKWKEFPNIGLEWGAYEQAITFLDIDDHTVCFFLQDDIIIKSWDFIDECIEKLNNGIKFIGNCTNYPTTFNPYEDSKIEGTFRDLVKPENMHIFTDTMNIKTIRGSFMCTLYTYIKQSNGFEPMFHLKRSLTPEKDLNGNFKMPGLNGLGGVGNTQLTLFAYKINKLFGHQSIEYLSTRYLDSDFIYECARGEIDNNNPIT